MLGVKLTHSLLCALKKLLLSVNGGLRLRALRAQVLNALVGGRQVSGNHIKLFYHTVELGLSGNDSLLCIRL